MGKPIANCQLPAPKVDERTGNFVFSWTYFWFQFYFYAFPRLRLVCSFFFCIFVFLFSCLNTSDFCFCFCFCLCIGSLLFIFLAGFGWVAESEFRLATSRCTTETGKKRRRGTVRCRQYARFNGEVVARSFSPCPKPAFNTFSEQQ